MLLQSFQTKIMTQLDILYFQGLGPPPIFTETLWCRKSAGIL